MFDEMEDFVGHFSGFANCINLQRFGFYEQNVFFFCIL